LLHDVKNGVKS